MRVATIDIGTNSVLLLVAESSESQGLRAICERATVTRLGEGVDQTRTLSSAAIARTLDCLSEYAAVVASLNVDRTRAVGTSALRDASGGDQFCVAARHVLGVDVDVLSGDEEARMTFAGALSGLDQIAVGMIAVFDVGGGSTEFVLGDRQRISYAVSVDIGSVRLTERHVHSDPPTQEELDAVARDARQTFATLAKPMLECVAVGVAGTVTTLAAVMLGLDAYAGDRVHGHQMSVIEVGDVADRLAALPLGQRKLVPGLQPERAEVIVAGALIVKEMLVHLGSYSLVVSDRGVRWGVAYELASR